MGKRWRFFPPALRTFPLGKHRSLKFICYPSLAVAKR